MEPLCTSLYDALRPRFILLQRLDDLCELVDILKHEVSKRRPSIQFQNCSARMRKYRYLQAQCSRRPERACGHPQARCGHCAARDFGRER